MLCGFAIAWYIQLRLREAEYLLPIQQLLLGLVI
jgi:hypothetical protein